MFKLNKNVLFYLENGAYGIDTWPLKLFSVNSLTSFSRELALLTEHLFPLRFALDKKLIQKHSALILYLGGIQQRNMDKRFHYAMDIHWSYTVRKICGRCQKSTICLEKHSL